MQGDVRFDSIANTQNNPSYEQNQSEDIYPEKTEYVEGGYHEPELRYLTSVAERDLLYDALLLHDVYKTYSADFYPTLVTPALYSLAGRFRYVP